MIFQSTRGNSELVDFSSAILNGIAFDGGLYIPKEYTPISSYTVSKASQLSWKEWSSGALTEIIPDDKLTPQWREICESAFNFPLILKNLDTSTSVLELFHGPTSAFKDFGARFLVACLERTLTSEQIRKSRLLVATSGDTGGAVASAFTSQTQIPVVILYPKGKISARQEKQLTCWKNCQAFAVEGSFDDCQALVKKAFADRDLNSKYNLLSANSINIGRLLPQMLYHAYTASQYYYKTKIKPTLIIPSGNMGHAFGALWAHKLGFPIKKIIFAHNENHSVPDYFKTKQWLPNKTVYTLANAMDVGSPSNMERILFLFPDFEELKKVASAYSISDEEIKKTIQARKWNQIWCPHTAIAVHVREQLAKEEHCIIAATAHPAKFETIVEPLIGESVLIPTSLDHLMRLPNRSKTIPNSYSELLNILA